MTGTPVVTIHSWNPEGARNMAHVLNDWGHDCTIRPYETAAWIGTVCAQPPTKQKTDRFTRTRTGAQQ